MSLDTLLERKERREQDALRVVCNDMKINDYMLFHNLGRNATSQYLLSARKELRSFDMLGDVYIK